MPPASDDAAGPTDSLRCVSHPHRTRIAYPLSLRALQLREDAFRARFASARTALRDASHPLGAARRRTDGRAGQMLISLLGVNAAEAPPLCRRVCSPRGRLFGRSGERAARAAFRTEDACARDASAQSAHRRVAKRWFARGHMQTCAQRSLAPPSAFPATVRRRASRPHHRGLPPTIRGVAGHPPARRAHHPPAPAPSPRRSSARRELIACARSRLKK